MALTVASLQAILELNNSDFDRGLRDSSNELTGFERNISSAIGAIGMIGAAVGVFAGVGAAVVGMTNAAREAAAINRDLEQTIISTGGVAGVTADAARDLADSLTRVTNFEDDAIVKGEAMLLTFTKIGKDVFPLATEAMLDMAQKFGSMDSASVQLGKALNDPLKGISALQRVGVTFSATQKQQIKDFMAVNDIASAQKVILSELATEFGGQARAAVDPVIQLQNAVGNLNEALGTGFLPVVNSLVSGVLPGFLDLITTLGEIMPGVGAMMAEVYGPVFEILGTAISDIAAAFSSLQDGLTEISTALGFGTEKVNLFRIALLPVLIPIALLAGLIEALSWVIAGVGHAFGAAGYVIKQVATALGLTNDAMSSAASWAQTVANDWGFLTAAAQTLWQWILNIIEGWRLLIATMSQPVNLPAVLTPGSPTPMENALKGIGAAITTMPVLDMSRVIATGNTGTSSTYNTTNLNMGGQNMTFQGNNANDQALVAVLQLLRGQLQAAG